MQLDMLWAFIIIYTLDSITPGPATAMVMSRGASIGLTRSLPFIAGLVIGDLVLFLAALLGLVALAQAYAPIFLIIKWVGVCYLLYLAYSSWTAKPGVYDIQPVAGTGCRSFFLALLYPLGNPKAVGFYVALLPAFMDLESLSIVTALNFSVVIVVIWGLVLVGYAALADQGRKRFKGSVAQKWLNRCAAIAMLGAAGTVASQS